MSVITGISSNHNRLDLSSRLSVATSGSDQKIHVLATMLVNGAFFLDLSRHILV